MSSEVRELEDELDFEFWAEREGLRFKHTHGSSGPQLNFQSCPKCGDRKWKTYTNRETGRGNCFKCSETFKGKIDFITHVTDLKFRDVMVIVRDTLKDQGWRPKKKSVAVQTDSELIKLPLSFELPTPDGANLTYLEERGVTAELAGFFHLRFSEFGSWRYTKDDGAKFSQNFSNRVIIPVYDLDGTLQTFQGRDVLGTAERKYLFPVGLPGTGRFLLNGQNAVRAKRVLMGEGAFDVIAAKGALDQESDLRDVVPIGSFGKHLSFGSIDGNDQLGRFLELKSYGLEEVTIMWDGEPKALIAALDAAKLLHGVGLRAKIARLPPGCDPNEVLPEIVRKAFREAELYTHKLAVKWRLRNPYSCRSQTVKTDC